MLMLHRACVVLLFVALGSICLAQAADNQSLTDLQRLLDKYKAEMNAGKYTAAEQTAKQMLAIGEANLRSRPDMKAQFHDLLADSYRKQERYTEEMPHRVQQLALTEQWKGAGTLAVADVLDSLANCHENLEQHDREVVYRERSLTIRERQLGRNHAGTVGSRDNLCGTYMDLARYKDEEPLRRLNLAILQAARPKDQAEIGRALINLANCVWNQNRYSESVEFYQQAADVRASALGETHERTVFSRRELIQALVHVRQIDRAEQVHKQIVAAVERESGKESVETADTLFELGVFYQEQLRYSQAEGVWKRCLAIREKALGPDHLDVAYDLHNLAWLYQVRGVPEQALPLERRALAMREKQLEADSPDVASALANLAAVHVALSQYAEAEALHKQALAIREKAAGEDDLDVAYSLAQLGLVYREQGRLAEAEALLRRALAVRVRLCGERSIEVADSQNDLAILLAGQSRSAEAEQYYKQSVATRAQIFSPERTEIGDGDYSLASFYHDQGRLDEAETLTKRAIANWEHAYGADHFYTSLALGLLANVKADRGELNEAEELNRRVLGILEKARGPKHVDLAYTLHNLGDVHVRQKRYPEAQSLHERGLAIREVGLGAEHPLVAESLRAQAECLSKQNQHAQAEPLLDRAILILDRVHAKPVTLCGCYQLRAEASWKAGRKNEAVSDLREAMTVVEQMRGQSAGAEHERATSFGRFTGLYEQMVAWQSELGNLDDAFQALEQGHARSLLDEMNLTGVDVNIGRTAAQRQRAIERESQLKSEIAKLEGQLTRAKAPAERDPIKAELARVREQLYDHYRSERSASEVYRTLLSSGSGPPRLSQVQRQLGVSKDLMLVYLFGEDAGYLLMIAGDQVKLSKLEITASQAKILGANSGPLTQKVLGGLMLTADRKGIVQQLAASHSSPPPVEKLHALWQVLMPEAAQQELLSGKYRSALVVPDGPLALLPMETLVVKSGDDPQYLLDVGAPLAYGQSATVLYNLMQRSRAAQPMNSKPILTVGDPSYLPADPPVAAATQQSSATRYAGLAGPLSPLPHTALESAWVTEVFGRQGINSERLVKADATEANVRGRAPGRRIVHLACHGLTDQSYGNFFGALALTPGAQAASDPANDGFLTLPEIYGLDLRQCELAILSACETNYGPQQHGEGVWTLSRGFLVAGARRVVASSWLVDDQAAASLVSAFCDKLAKSEKAGQKTDYADSLRTARRWVRQQEKWSSPYYWGTFVLVGPN